MHRMGRAAWLVDAQRREDKRMEARLAGGLRQLDEACLYHISTLTREQRRLTRDLGTTGTGNLCRKNVFSLQSQPWGRNDGHQMPSYRKTVLPIIPQKPEKHRSLNPVLRNAGWTSTGLQTRVREFIGGRGVKTVGSVLPVCLPDLKGQSADGPNTTELGKKCQGETSIETDSRKQTEKEKGVLSTPPPFQELAPDGKLRTVYTLPSFAQALAEARKARYLRLRGRPLCERELSIEEIFARTPTEN
ncbi:coiled-coil domain-containing protein 190 [Scleropages formosus]|uniref:coiled-coil domain-containing protein 190 n=1 Tax=Scleropages formosus TaxID=113540 RepID=UPI000878FE85|nr:coiled-coil domain-containing protein 190-like [Scleropages formosus]